MDKQRQPKIWFLLELFNNKVNNGNVNNFRANPPRSKVIFEKFKLEETDEWKGRYKDFSPSEILDELRTFIITNK